MDKPEKRQKARLPIIHKVFMATGISPPLNCQMLDVSEYGARLRVGAPKTAPQEFLIVLDKGLTRWCQVVWRSDTEIGIKFVDPPQSLKTKEKPEETTEEE